jgi:hypothetical protein
MESEIIGITALYDINRHDRSFEFYIEKIKDLFRFKLPLIIFCGQKTYLKLKDITRDSYTKFIVNELEDLKFYKNHLSEITNNLTNPIYKTNVKHYGRIETVNPLYNIIQYSKFDFLCQVKTIIDCKNYMWIDAGVSRFFKQIPTTYWPNINKLTSNKIIVQSFNQPEIQSKFKTDFYSALTKINMHDECKDSRYLIIGTTFVVPNKDVEWLHDNINNIFQEMINIGYLNNEQLAMEFVIKNNLDRFDIKINKSNNWYNMMEYI